jgi:hypothetical protein
VQMKLKDFAKKLDIDRGTLNGDSLIGFLEKEIKNRRIPIQYEIKEVEENSYITLGDFNLGKSDTATASRSINWQKFIKYVGRKDLSPTQFLDSLGWESRTPRTLKAAEQAMKIGRNDLSMFILNVINNIPLMMILMLPLIALYLKFFYLFSKKLYIEHLVFTFHFQSFNYVLLAIVLLIIKYWENVVGEVFTYATLIWIVYSTIALKRVYKQSWFMTLFKLFWIGMFYITTLSIFQLGVLVYSFFTY